MMKAGWHYLILRLGLAFWLLAAGRAGANNTTNLIQRLKPAPLCASLAAAARTHGIPLEPIDSPGETNLITPGDSVTALITLHKKARLTQCLVYLEAVPPDSKEEPTNQPAPLVLHTSTGHRLEFVSEPVNATVRTLGPFAENSSGKTLDKSARITVDKGFLGIGFDQSTAAILRLRTTGQHGAINVAPQPFSDAQVSEGTKLAEAVSLTPAEERAIAGSFPALFSYFGIIQQTPGLDAIFFEIVDLPPVWSLIRHAGIKNLNLVFLPKQAAVLTNAPVNLPGNPPVYSFPMGIDLDGHRALNLTFVVTAPRPPILACAGIVGLLAERLGDTNTYLTLQVISARRAKNLPGGIEDTRHRGSAPPL
jgi:hypothetical protein